MNICPRLGTFWKWYNQFYVLDVLNWLGSNVRTDDTWTIMDSDIVWGATTNVDRLWMSLREIASSSAMFSTTAG